MTHPVLWYMYLVLYLLYAIVMYAWELKRMIKIHQNRKITQLSIWFMFLTLNSFLTLLFYSKKPPPAPDKEDIPSYVTQYDGTQDGEKKPSIKPEFVVPLNNNLKKKEGSSAHFACRLQPAGDPTMRVEWLKNNTPLFIGESNCLYSASFLFEIQIPLAKWLFGTLSSYCF